VFVPGYFVVPDYPVALDYFELECDCYELVLYRYWFLIGRKMKRVLLVEE
jgi:hypothetical protein